MPLIGSNFLSTDGILPWVPLWDWTLLDSEFEKKTCDPSIFEQPETCQKPAWNMSKTPQWALWVFSSLSEKKAKSMVFPTCNWPYVMLWISLIWFICQKPAVVVSQWFPGSSLAAPLSMHHTVCPIFCYNCKGVRGHSSITSSRRWVGGVKKWKFLMIYSTVNHQRVGWVGLKKSKTWWRNTWMVPNKRILKTNLH